MKKIEQRALLCLILAGLLVLGLGVFLLRYAMDGRYWASSPFNRHLYNSAGQLKTGRVLDRNGLVLSYVDADGKRAFAEGKTIRKATLHVVGDPSGSIGTGALSAFADKLTGYNLLGGAFTSGRGRDLYLTVDANANEAAYKALDGHKGAVAVYNYRTGEMLCMVSAPSFDPQTMPDNLESDPGYEGVYLNRVLSSTFTPGSIFKTVTLAAALEKLPNVTARKWICQGSIQLGEGTVICTAAHGEQDLQDALANSCNVVFGQLALELGPDTLERYCKRAGLTTRYRVDGIPTAAGSFPLKDLSHDLLAWAGVGQYHDAVNPCAMMVYMGAIANGGQAAQPKLIQRVDYGSPAPSPQDMVRWTGTLIRPDTAQAMADMMRYNVTQTYGTKRFPDMDLCAKSGTAETSPDAAPHAWFTGFLRDTDHPYAFVVLVENGGSGAGIAGDVASKVLRYLVAD